MKLSIGDTIKCADKEDCVNMMLELAKEGVKTDFLYEKDGKKGFWLEVEKLSLIHI